MDPFYWFKRHEISRGISYRAALQPPLLSSLASGVKKKIKKSLPWNFVVCFFVSLFYFYSSPLFFVGVTYRESGSRWCFWKLTSIECEVWIDPYIRGTFWIGLIFIRNYDQCSSILLFFIKVKTSIINYKEYWNQMNNDIEYLVERIMYVFIIVCYISSFWIIICKKIIVFYGI